MEEFKWCVLGELVEDDIWHTVKSGDMKTLCGLPVADASDARRWRESLGDGRPCDNCTEILARHEDVPDTLL